jgi:molybdopterin-binding protein
MATVKVRLNGGEQIVTASITKEAAEELGLAEGTPTTVLVKSTEVMLGVD